MNAVIYHFLDLLVDATPWFLGGAILGAVIEAFVPAKWVLRWLGTQRSSVFNAAVAGAVLPGCSITTVPLAAALKSRGARLGTLAAFIMISPILSPETIVLTAAMLGWKITAARIILPLLVTLAMGLAINSFETKRRPGFRLPLGKLVDPRESGCKERSGFWQNLVGLLHPLWLYFVVGLLAVALLQTFVPQQIVAKYMHGGFVAYVVAAGAGIPLYVCEGAEVPLTYGLMKLGVGAGPAFTFLLGAVGTCVPTIAMAPRIIGYAATYVYVGVWLLLAIGGGWLVSFLF
jgi:uncharacterized protein